MPPEAFLGRRVDEVLPPPTGPRFVGLLDRVRREGQPVVADYSLPFPEGERHFEARLQALAGGRVAALCTDVTARRRIEDESRRQKAQLEHLVSLSPAVIYSLRLAPEGAALATVGDNLVRLLGWSEADIADPEDWAEKIHPDDRAAALAAGPRVLAEGHVVHGYRFRHRNGTWRWIRDEMRLVRDEAGRPLEVVGAFSDVTAQHVTEERLRESEERFRELIEKGTDLLAVFDAEGRVAFCTEQSARVLGYPLEEILGRPGSDMVVPHDADRAKGVLAELRPTPGASARIELRMRRGDGSTLVFDSLVCNLLHVPAIRGFVVSSRDVTEQRQLEARFLQAQKLESVGRLAGGVAHDFNNLLVAILGYAEFLERGIRAGTPSLEDLAEIRDAGERARDLTRQLLAVARRQVVEPRVMDLNEVLRDAGRLLRRVLGEDVELAVVPAVDLWCVRADPAQIQQVVLNLAVNARDAMPEGGRLTLETANVDLDERYAAAHPGSRPGPHVLLAVSDSGTGMSDEAKAHLFEPFFTTKPAGQGSGLGLATVYGIVRQAGGHVWVYSEPGRGTSVKVYLSRCEEAAAAPEPRRDQLPRRGTETVLVVEDAPPVRELAARALAEAGYQVLEARDGREALAAAARFDGPLHLLLTDLVMPDMSGQKLAQALVQARPGTRVLYMSGYTENTVVHHGVLDPGVHFLAKPFTPTALQEKVRRVLDGE